MLKFTEQYDVVVVGAGHAGCEASMAAARMGLKTALFTLNVDWAKSLMLWAFNSDC